MVDSLSSESGRVLVGSVESFELVEARKVVVADKVLAVVRIGDDFYALDDTCTHADASLSEGEVFDDVREIECPRHAASFSLETGEPQSLPATEPARTYAVEVVGAEVWLVLA